MKTALDPRHKKRQKLVASLFALDFHKQKADKESLKIFSKKNAIDMYIQKAAPEFSIDKINRADLAILRLAVFELMFEEKKQPPRVVVDEAIELAKELGGETSPAFINGALGNLLSYASSAKNQAKKTRKYDRSSKNK